MIDATFCNAVSLLTGFTGWVLAVWSFLRPETVSYTHLDVYKRQSLSL